MLVIDIEATGTNAAVHSIVSIGAVDLQQPDRRFYGECTMWTGAHVMDDALAVNGFTMAEITDPDKQTEAELVTTFMAWTQDLIDRTPAGQNVSFDRAYLEAACARAGIRFDLPFRTIDAHTLCYLHMIKQNVIPPFDVEHKHSALNLDGVMNYCGLPDEPDPHNALTGAMSHAEV
jgi:DNA polymerase III epsilon subunit-like protein